MNKNLVSTFSERLKECLDKETSISATTLAEEIGMSKQAISMYISGNRNPKRPTIKAIAEILKVDEAWLMGYDVPMRPESSGNSEPEKNNESNQIKDKDLIVLYRKLEKVPDEERQMMIEQFNSSIDVFLKRKGLIE